MKYKVKDIVATLQSLPKPERHGQVLNVPIIKGILDIDYTKNADICCETEKYIVLTAERYMCNGRTWLEWEYDV